MCACAPLSVAHRPGALTTERLLCQHGAPLLYDEARTLLIRVFLLQEAVPLPTAGAGIGLGGIGGIGGGGDALSVQAELVTVEEWRELVRWHGGGDGGGGGGGDGDVGGGGSGGGGGGVGGSGVAVMDNGSTLPPMCEECYSDAQRHAAADRCSFKVK
jgi:hypothetical protein